jgi:hypothetical protein
MNELQHAVVDRLRLLAWLHKDGLTSQAESYKKLQSELFRISEAAGIINQWKRRNAFERMAVNPPRGDA